MGEGRGVEEEKQRPPNVLFWEDTRDHGQEQKTDRQTDRQTGRQADRQTDRQADRQTDRQTDTQTDRQTSRQTDRQTDRETEVIQCKWVHRQTWEQWPQSAMPHSSHCRPDRPDQVPGGQEMHSLEPDRPAEAGRVSAEGGRERGREKWSEEGGGGGGISLGLTVHMEVAGTGRTGHCTGLEEER